MGLHLCSSRDSQRFLLGKPRCSRHAFNILLDHDRFCTGQLLAIGQELEPHYSWEMFQSQPDWNISGSLSVQPYLRYHHFPTPAEGGLEAPDEQTEEDRRLGPVWDWSIVSLFQYVLGFCLTFFSRACSSSSFRFAASIEFYKSRDTTYTFSSVALRSLGEATGGFIVFCGPAVPKAIEHLSSKNPPDLGACLHRVTRRFRGFKREAKDANFVEL